MPEASKMCNQTRLKTVIYDFFLLIKIPGDEVVEWNGRSLHGKSVQDVYEIISETRQEPQVELIVSRLIAANRKAAQASWRQSHSPTRLNQKGIKA